MEEALRRYVAESVVEDIRDGEPLQEDVALACNSRPQIDVIRSLITREDAPKLLALTESEQECVRGLAFSLLKRIENTPETEAFLKDLWRRRRDFATRHAIMWRILDFTDLEREFHEEMYRFVRENWDDFLAGQLRFMGGEQGPPGVLPSVRSRLTDPAFPRSKDWAFLCILPASDDPEGCRELLESYLTSDNSIVSKVATEMSAEIRNG